MKTFTQKIIGALALTAALTLLSAHAGLCDAHSAPSLIHSHLSWVDYLVKVLQQDFHFVHLYDKASPVLAK